MPGKRNKSVHRSSRGSAATQVAPPTSPPSLYKAEFTGISVLLTKLRRISERHFGQLHYEDKLPYLGKTRFEGLVAQYVNQQNQYKSATQALSKQNHSKTIQKQLVASRRYFELLAIGLLWKLAEQMGNEPTLPLEETDLRLLSEVKGYLSAYTNKTPIQEAVVELLTEGSALIKQTQSWRDPNTSVEPWQRPVKWQVFSRECRHYEERLKTEYGQQLRGWWEQTSNREQMKALIGDEIKYKAAKQAIENYDSWRATPLIGGIFRLFRVCWGWNLQKNRALIGYYDALSLLRDLQKHPEKSDLLQIQAKIASLKVHSQRLSQRSALRPVLNEVVQWLEMIRIDKYMMNFEEGRYVGESMGLLAPSNERQVIFPEKGPQAHIPSTPPQKKASGRQTVQARLEEKAAVFVRSVQAAEEGYWKRFIAGDKGLSAYYDNEIIKRLDADYQTAKASLTHKSSTFWEAGTVPGCQHLITLYDAFKHRVAATRALLAAKVAYDEIVQSASHRFYQAANLQSLIQAKDEIETSLQVQWAIITHARRTPIIKNDVELIQKLAPIYQAWEEQKTAAEKQIQAGINKYTDIFSAPEHIRKLEKNVAVLQTKNELTSASFVIYPKRVEVIKAYFEAIENPMNRDTQQEHWQEKVLNDAVLNSKRGELKKAYHEYSRHHYPDKIKCSDEVKEEAQQLATGAFQRLQGYLTDIDKYIEQHLASDIQLCAESSEEFSRRKEAAIAEIKLQQDCQSNARDLAQGNVELAQSNIELKQQGLALNKLEQKAAETQAQYENLERMVRELVPTKDIHLFEKNQTDPTASSTPSPRKGF